MQKIYFKIEIIDMESTEKFLRKIFQKYFHLLQTIKSFDLCKPLSKVKFLSKRNGFLFSAINLAVLFLKPILGTLQATSQLNGSKEENDHTTQSSFF